jgi:hypothetical protein
MVQAWSGQQWHVGFLKEAFQVPFAFRLSSCSVQLSSTSINCVAQDLPFIKPCWSVVNRLCLSMWSNMQSLINLSIDLDFQKAFDTVPHQRLINKLQSYGICGNILWWIRDFLANRKQNVLINGTGLEWTTVFLFALLLFYISQIIHCCHILDVALLCFRIMLKTFIYPCSWNFF